MLPGTPHAVVELAMRELMDWETCDIFVTIIACQRSDCFPNDEWESYMDEPEGGT